MSSLSQSAQHRDDRRHIRCQTSSGSVGKSAVGSCIVRVPETYEPAMLRSKRHLCSLAPAADISEAAACLGQEV